MHNENLNKLHEVIRRKRPEKHYDNVRSHVANVVKENIQQNQWRILEHPPHSPDLIPCDFHILDTEKCVKKVARRIIKRRERIFQSASMYLYINISTKQCIFYIF